MLGRCYSFILPERLCYKHKNQPVCYVSVTAEPSEEVFMCSLCVQQSQPTQNGSSLPLKLKNIRGMLQQLLSDEVKPDKVQDNIGYKISQTLKDNITVAHMGELQHVEGKLVSEKQWVAEAVLRCEKELAAKFPPAKKPVVRRAADYLQNFSDPYVVLLKLQLSSNYELLRFRDTCFEMETVATESLNRAEQLVGITDHLSKHLQERIAGLFSCRLHRLVKEELNKDSLCSGHTRGSFLDSQQTRGSSTERRQPSIQPSSSKKSFMR